MSGIVRAPSNGVDFEIPYSGAHATGDCILVNSAGAGSPTIVAYYISRWIYQDYITGFSDENNVISFHTTNIVDNGNAALIPGPNHV